MMSEDRIRPCPRDLVRSPDPTFILPATEIALPVPDVMSVFFEWERLRVIYNAALVAVVVFITWSNGLLLIIPLAIVPAILANLCFCAGPVAECYLCWLGVPRGPARWFVFGVGLCLSIGVTAHECIRLRDGFPFFA